MTVQTLASAVLYLGNGSTTQFAVPFKVLDVDHLVVKRLVAATGVLDHTYIGMDYSYSGIGADSGTLTLSGAALSSTYKLSIERIVPYTQDLDLVNTGGFYPETVETQLDLMVMGVQQTNARIDEIPEIEIDATLAAAVAARDRSQTNADLTVTNATASAASAVAAGLYAAAAQALATGLYATTGAGISGTTNGQYFLVVGSGNTYASLYKNVAGVATSQSLDIPSLAALTAITGTSTTYGTTTADTSTATAGASFAYITPTAHDGLLTSVAFRLSASGTGEIRFIQLQGAYLVDIGTYPVTGASGLNTITLGSAGAHSAAPSLPDTLFLPANTYVEYVPLTGGRLRYAAGAGSDIALQVNDDSGLGSSTISFTNITNVILALSMTVVESGLIPQQPVYDAGTDTHFASGAMTTTSTVATFTGTLHRNGANTRTVGSVTVTAATGSNVRYDQMVYNRETGAFTAIAGTERANDAAEFIPALTDPKQIPVANLRVTSAGIMNYTSLWDIVNNEPAVLARYLRQERERSKPCLRRTRQKIGSGSGTLRFLSVGDSNMAIVSQTPSTATPDGPYRDRATASGTTYTYLRDKIGSDAPGWPGSVTYAQLGRGSDAAGAVYTKFGFVWERIKALEGVGRTLGTNLFYNNFSVNGTTSADIISGGVLTSWGTAVIAYIVANSVDCVEVGFGMNELNSATTEANLVAFAQAIKAASPLTEFIMNGAPRRRSTMVGWYYTNRAIRSAARYVNAAHVDTVPLFDNPFIGSAGLSIYDVGAANGDQHIGILEHHILGAAGIKLLLD